MVSLTKTMEVTKKGMWLRQGANGRYEVTDCLLAILMILPAAILISAFAIYPVIQGLVASFYRVDSATLAMTFHGLNNYIDLFTELLFWESLGRTIIWTAATIAIQMVLGLAISLLLHHHTVSCSKHSHRCERL